MKRLTLILAASLLLMACSKEEPAPEPVRPVLSMEVKAEDQETLGRFAGTIQARYESNLGFRVSGVSPAAPWMWGLKCRRGPCSLSLTPPTSKTSCAPPKATSLASRRNSSTPRPTLAASRNCSTVASAPRRSWISPRS